jgi:hypothetical protein
MSKKSACDKYWAKLMGQAKTQLMGASDIELKVQLFDTLQEFFDFSNCWREPISITVIPNTLVYPLIPMSGRILRLLGVYDQNNVPQQACMPEIGKVQFMYGYSNTQPMTAVVVKNVTDPLECYPPYMPDWILPQYGTGILSGLLGYMMLQSGTSYSNQGQSAFHLSRFRATIAHAKAATYRANAIGSQNWAFPQSFRVGGQRGGVSTFNVHPQVLR